MVDATGTCRGCRELADEDAANDDVDDADVEEEAEDVEADKVDDFEEVDDDCP